MILIDSVLDFVAIMLDESLNWPSCSVSQGANGMSFDLLCKFPQHIDLSIVSFSYFHALEGIS